MLAALTNKGQSKSISAIVAGGGWPTKVDGQGCVWLGEASWDGGVPLGYKTADPIFALAKQSGGYVLAMPPLHTTKLILMVLGDRKTTICFCQPSLVSQHITEIQNRVGFVFQPYSPGYLDKSPLAQAPLGLLAPLQAYAGVTYAILYVRRVPNPEAMFPGKLLS